LANLFENKDRRVIPNWREFDKTVFLGELDFYHTAKLSKPTPDISNYIQDWIANKSVIHAAELVSAAVVNNVRNDINVLQAAKFIIQRPKESTISQLSLSVDLLKAENESDLRAESNLLENDDLTDTAQMKIIHRKIANLRVILKQFPNAISYVELARCFSIIGLKDKASDAMKKALHMGSNNRFVLRSASRLFVHNGDFELAHDILRRNALTLIDPWLLSAEISVAMIQERSSRFVKKGLELINSKNISPFNFTELASSLATLEMNEGSIKKSRKLFMQSLLKPNDNSLAQIEWASHKDGQQQFNPALLSGVNLNYEALSSECYYSKQFRAAITNAIKWFNDMPYSKRPIMFASSVASSIMNDQETAISLAKAGLVSHPNDASLINNLAYALALNDQPNEALEWLSKIKIGDDIDDTTKTCIMATKGLIMFRNGNAKIGRKLYFDALEMSKSLTSHFLNWKAILNYAREELLIRSEFVEAIMETVARIPESVDHIEIAILRKRVIMLYERYKQNIMS
jgi:hypothetical protein